MRLMLFTLFFTVHAKTSLANDQIRDGPPARAVTHASVARCIEDTSVHIMTCQDGVQALAPGSQLALDAAVTVADAKMDEYLRAVEIRGGDNGHARRHLVDHLLHAYLDAHHTYDALRVEQRFGREVTLPAGSCDCELHDTEEALKAVLDLLKPVQHDDLINALRHLHHVRMVHGAGQFFSVAETAAID